MLLAFVQKMKRFFRVKKRNLIIIKQALTAVGSRPLPGSIIELKRNHMTPGPLLLSLSNKWLWPGTAQPRWAAQVPGPHATADQRAQGGEAAPFIIPLCTLLLSAALQSPWQQKLRKPPSFLGHSTGHTDGSTSKSICGHSSHPPSPQAAGPSPFTLSLPSALPILPASWPDARHRPRV